MKRIAQGCPDVVPPAEANLACIARQLMLLPAILAGLSELRQLVTGRLVKSHLTVEEVAEMVGRAPYTVRSWIREGRVTAIRVSGTGPKGRLLVPRDELRKLVVLEDDPLVSVTPAP